MNKCLMKKRDCNETNPKLKLEVSYKKIIEVKLYVARK